MKKIVLSKSMFIITLFIILFSCSSLRNYLYNILVNLGGNVLL